MALSWTPIVSTTTRYKCSLHFVKLATMTCGMGMATIITQPNQASFMEITPKIDSIFQKCILQEILTIVRKVLPLTLHPRMIPLKLMSLHLTMVCIAIAGKGKMRTKQLGVTTTTAHSAHEANCNTGA